MSPSTTQPLFAPQRASSSHSDERAAAEDDALLGGQSKGSSPRSKPTLWREAAVFIWALLATAAVIVLAVLLTEHGASHDKTSRPTKRNLIFMVSDGMGPASLSLTRSFRQYERGLLYDDVLSLDQHFIGSSRTRSNSSLVTDSAAGATAFSCGKKSYNGAISMLPDHTPCGTVLEAAKRKGYLTGLVVTTDITDATPACFSAHQRMRTGEDSIASQQIGEHPLGMRVVDLMFGGGRCHFLPNSTQNSCRNDDRDILKLARESYGWNYISNREQFDALDSGNAVELPILGLFSDIDFPFELDRRNMNETYPSLDEMSRTALRALEEATRDSDQGFFLMIEGSRIDHAGHGNDPAAQVHEVLAYDRAFSSVIEFLENSDVEGIVISTSDHETGGLSVARQIHESYPHYLWYPEVLANASHSSEFLARQLRAYKGSSSSLEEFIRTELVQNGLGIFDATDAEIGLIVNTPNLSVYYFADMISRRARVGWSTHGHSAVDVNLYGSKGSDELRGTHENTDVGKFLREYLSVDVDAITEELISRSNSEAGLYSWNDEIPNQDEMESTSNHYQDRIQIPLFG